MSWADNSIVRPAHELIALRGGRTILLSAQLVASWADNRFVHVSFIRNPQRNCNKPIVSDIQSHENNVCVRFVSLNKINHSEILIAWTQMKLECLWPFRLSRTKFIAAWVRNNDIFSPSREAARVENKSLFLTKAAMNFVRERRNGRKRYSHDFEYQKL